MAGEDPIISGVAGRYATALFDLAKESGSLDAVLSDLTALERMLSESADLKRLVKSPLYGRDEQTKAMEAVLAKAGAADLTRKFVGLLAANRRLFILDDTARAFRALVARHRGELTADVVSAHPLTDVQLQKLVDSLNTSTGRKVHVNASVDQGLLGGLVVKLGSRMVDTSLRTKLNRLKLAMKEAG